MLYHFNTEQEHDLLQSCHFRNALYSSFVTEMLPHVGKSAEKKLTIVTFGKLMFKEAYMVHPCRYELGTHLMVVLMLVGL